LYSDQQSVDKAATSGTETELDSVPVSRKVMSKYSSALAEFGMS